MRTRRSLPLLAMALAACAEKSQRFANDPVPPTTTATEVASQVSAPPVTVADAPPPPAVIDVAKSPKDLGPVLSTRNLVAWIFEQPNLQSQHVGSFRAGARVQRSAEPVKGPPCGTKESKWYAVLPRGFVCDAHDGVTLDMNDPAVQAGALFPPKAEDPFPYGYATSWGSPLYVRLPTPAEQKRMEGDIDGRIRARETLRMKMSPARRWPESALPLTETPPPFLADHALAPNFVDQKLAPNALVAGNAWPDMRISLVNAFASDGRTFYVTSENFIVPGDRVRPAKLAEFHGVELAAADQPAGEHLPMLWVNWKPTPVYKLEPGGALRVTKAMLPVQAHAAIKKEEMQRGEQHFFELVAPPTADLDPGGRYFVAAGSASRLDALTELPTPIKADDLWMDIAIGHQTLVLYKGLTPIFATLVSTGIDGAGDPEKTRSTPRGTFRVLSKHITSRMQADEKPPQKDGDKPDPRYRVDDVPYVQFFHAGYALHGAYWHDAFGQPKSHGCVNLSPRDALYLFQKTTPGIPEGWHAAMGGRAGAEPGTFVHVRVF